MIRGKDVVWVVWEGRGMKGRLKVGFQTTFGICGVRGRSPRYVGFQTTLGQRSKAALMRRLV